MTTQSDNAAITGGTVKFSQSRKLAEYENRSAEISFNVGNGADVIATLDKAIANAVFRVFALLELPVPVHLLELNNAPATPPKKTPKKPPATPSAEPKTEDPLADLGGAPVANISTGEERVEPANVMDDSLFSPSEEVAKVKDTDLSSAITTRNAALQKVHGDKSPVMIRTLIGKYVSPPKRAQDMTPVQRVAFLKELAALT